MVSKILRIKTKNQDIAVNIRYSKMEKNNG